MQATDQLSSHCVLVRLCCPWRGVSLPEETVQVTATMCVRPCAQVRCGRCPPGSGVMSDLLFFFWVHALIDLTRSPLSRVSTAFWTSLMRACGP